MTDYVQLIEQDEWEEAATGSFDVIWFRLYAFLRDMV